VGRGTGLGLATVYGIVKQNNGFINVYSEPGEGTTFKVYLPCAEGGSSGAPIESAADAPRRGTETVLIVEDEEALLEICSQMLESLGYSVLTAQTPAEAIRAMGENREAIQLVITDVVMPQMNGRELASQLRALRPGLRCLFMSGYTADVIAQRSMLEEGAHFISKPFSIRALAEKVREAVS
jgi:CheY-like chemotaxis protein